MSKQKEKPLSIFSRSKVRLMHHLFKGSVEKFLKNTSWQRGVVRIEPVEHVHFYHTINSMGMEQKYTNSVGGHFHEVKVVKNESGEIVRVDCGPALKKIMRKTPSGLGKTTYEPIKFDDKENGQIIVDDHKHSFEYKGSDEIIPNKLTSVMPQEPTSIKNDEVEFSVVD